MNRQHVDRTRQRAHVGVECGFQFLFDVGGQSAPVGVVQPDTERRQAPQHRLADPAGSHQTDVHTLQVVGALHAVGDVPAAVGRVAVGRHEIADESQYLHDRVLGDADAVAEGDFGDSDVMCDGGVEIDVIRTDSGGDRQLQLGRLRDAFRGQVRRPERL